MNGTKTRVVIAEDEPLARESLRTLLEEEDWIECVGEAEDGDRAIEIVNRLEPDVLFLDVQMPGKTGIEVLDLIEPDPLVVFTTAYDRYAVAAFELGAIDYLVKPFGRSRLQGALERVRRALADEVAADTNDERLRVAVGGDPIQRIFARHRDRIVPITLSDVVRFEAHGDYVAAHTSQAKHLIHVSLSDLEKRIDPDRFLRIHRSHLVNLDQIRQMRDYGDRRFQVEMTDGAEVIASRAGTRRLKALVS